ncbi:hypothetical protein CHS0354_002983 [Potamilus streckersoni]|uniref:Sushi domain-containing protein n=1 Tax=Potamilus streckersoni TaxID=2493646 RepID=A0AAE0RSB0_9BIVA|nr:hypothetical protein CHS0354_002983 [Potamilus streckersoni]
MKKNGLIYFLLLWIVSICSVKCSCGMHIPHGEVTWWCATEGPVCSYSCHEGYKQHDDAKSMVFCTTSGEWISWSLHRIVSAKDICIPKPCPTVISKGAFSAACNAVVGSTCSFSCEAGYIRNSSVTEMTCQTSTEWSADRRSLCLRPDGQQCPYYIPRGDLSLTCIREPDHSCNFTCDEQYHPSISPSRIACGSNLEWNHNPESLCQGNVSRSTSERSGDGSGNRNLGAIVAIPVGVLTAIIFIFFLGWIAKRCSIPKRRELSHGGNISLRPRENPVRNATTIRQQPNVDGNGSGSSFQSPSYNGLYVHSFVQRIPTISRSCKYPGPPPSYSNSPSAPNEPPPTYEEAVMDHSSFNLFI